MTLCIGALMAFAVLHVAHAGGDDLTRQEAATSQRGSATADSIYAEWLGAPVGSIREQEAADAFFVEVERLFGGSAVEQYRAYLQAEVGSALEAAALDSAEVFGQRQAETVGVTIRGGRVRDLLSRYWSVQNYFLGFDDDPNETTLLDLVPPDLGVASGELELTITGPRTPLHAGRPFVLDGEFVNHSDSAVVVWSKGVNLQVPKGLADGYLTAHFGNNRKRGGIPRLLRPGEGVRFSWEWTGEEDRTEKNPGDDSSPFAVAASKPGMLDTWFVAPGEHLFQASVYVLVGTEAYKALRATDVDRHVYEEIMKDSPTSVVVAYDSAAFRVEAGTLVLFGALFVGSLLGVFLKSAIKSKTGGDPMFGTSKTTDLALLTLAIPLVAFVVFQKLGNAGIGVSFALDDVWGAALAGVVLQFLGVDNLVARLKGQ